MRKVLVFGTYDQLHDGHLQFFRHAREFGDSLHVVIARDATVEKLKGQQPQFNELQRLQQVQQGPDVDEALLGSTGDKYAVIENVQPDVICLGYDQHSFDRKLAEELEQRGLSHIEIHRLPSFHKDRAKSSAYNPSRFEQRLAQQLEQLGGQHDDAVVVGVSGGPDSTALLLALSQLGAPWKLRLHACHVNYGLRSAESDGDEAFVRDLCAQLQIPLSVHSAKNGETDEATLRQIRYNFFEQERLRLGANTIAIAHSYDDQAETVLLRVLRGAGLKGLSAMAAKNQHIIRPLLDVRREEILRYLDHHHQPFRVDSSNENLAYARNRVRHELLPLLRTHYNPSIDQRLVEVASVASDDYAYLRSQAEAMMTLLAVDVARVPGTPEGALLLDYRKWRSLHVAMQRETLRIAIERVRGSVEGIALVHLEEVREMLTNARVQGEKMLFGNLRIREAHDRIEVVNTDNYSA